MRLIKNISQDSLCKSVGISKGSLSTFEFDDAYPSPKNMTKIAEYLDVPLEYFHDDYYRFLFSDFPAILKSWRADNNLTQRQAAKILGVDVKTLWTWENRQYMDRVRFEKIKNVIKLEP